MVALPIGVLGMVLLARSSVLLVALPGGKGIEVLVTLLGGVVRPVALA